MTASLMVFLLGLFGVPLALLVLGHRLRRRPLRMRRMFIGAFVGHCVAAVLALTMGMIPPEAWTSEDTWRGFSGLWALLLLPVIGGLVGALSVGRRVALVVLGVASVAVALHSSRLMSQQPRPSLVGVIGNWTTTENGRVMTADGAGRSAAMTRAQFETAIRPFFPALSEEMVANGTAPGAFPLALWTGDSAFSSGTLRVQFNMLAGATDQNAGIVFGLQPNGEYHYVRYNTKDGDMAVWRFAKGDRVRIVHGKASTPLPLNAWHELVVRISGRRVVGTVNGTITVEHALERPLTGRVGLWTKRDAVTSFRNFRVE